MNFKYLSLFVGLSLGSGDMLQAQESIQQTQEQLTKSMEEESCLPILSLERADEVELTKKGQRVSFDLTVTNNGDLRCANVSNIRVDIPKGFDFFLIRPRRGENPSFEIIEKKLDKGYIVLKVGGIPANSSLTLDMVNKWRGEKNIISTEKNIISTWSCKPETKIEYKSSIELTESGQEIDADLILTNPGEVDCPEINGEVTIPEGYKYLEMIDQGGKYNLRVTENNRVVTYIVSHIPAGDSLVLNMKYKWLGEIQNLQTVEKSTAITFADLYQEDGSVNPRHYGIHRLAFCTGWGADNLFVVKNGVCSFSPEVIERLKETFSTEGFWILSGGDEPGSRENAREYMRQALLYELNSSKAKFKKFRIEGWVEQMENSFEYEIPKDTLYKYTEKSFHEDLEEAETNDEVVEEILDEVFEQTPEHYFNLKHDPLYNLKITKPKEYNEQRYDPLFRKKFKFKSQID